MASLDLGDIRTFPFLDPPDRRQITDGVTVLTELGAIDRGRPTIGCGSPPTGRSMAALPVDPRLARMIVEGDRQGCLAEMLVIAAALAIVDVREYPLDGAGQGDGGALPVRRPEIGLRGLLVALALPRGSRRGSCPATRSAGCAAAEYLNYLRIREWQDLHAQLRQIARGLGMTVPPGRPVRRGTGRGARSGAGIGIGDARRAAVPSRSRSTADIVHTAVLAGLLSHVGPAHRAGPGVPGHPRHAVRDLAGVGAGSRPARSWWSPPNWSRPAGSGAGSVPRWTRSGSSASAEHLLRRSYSEPRWKASRAAVVATEKVTLLGVTIVAARTVQFDRIDPELARELFIRHALVERDWTDPAPVLRRQRRGPGTTSATGRTGRGDATSSSTTKRCSRCTTRGYPPR